MVAVDFHYTDGTNTLFEHITSIEFQTSERMVKLQGADMLTSFINTRHAITLRSECAVHQVNTDNLRHLSVTKEN